MQTVSELYVGLYDESLIKSIVEETVLNGGEGIVIRTVEGFNYEKFDSHVAKYVRRNHVQTDEHWSMQSITKNNLMKN